MTTTNNKTTKARKKRQSSKKAALTFRSHHHHMMDSSQHPSWWIPHTDSRCMMAEKRHGGCCRWSSIIGVAIPWNSNRLKRVFHIIEYTSTHITHHPVWTNFMIMSHTHRPTYSLFHILLHSFLLNLLGEKAKELIAERPAPYSCKLQL